MSDDIDLDASDASQRRVLWIVLALNAGLAAGFAVAGALGDSNALIANGLDNASDALVYALSIAALTRGAAWKRGAARLSGVMLLLLAVGVLADAVRRYLTGSEPLGPTMIGMALVAAAVNALCLWLLNRVRNRDVNMRAARTFSLNDFASNGGIVVAGVLVLWTGRAWPDLVVGAIVALIALWGGVDILRDAHREAKEDKDGA